MFSRKQKDPKYEAMMRRLGKVAPVNESEDAPDPDFDFDAPDADDGSYNSYADDVTGENRAFDDEMERIGSGDFGTIESLAADFGIDFDPQAAFDADSADADDDRDAGESLWEDFVNEFENELSDRYAEFNPDKFAVDFMPGGYQLTYDGQDFDTEDELEDILGE